MPKKGRTALIPSGVVGLTQRMETRSNHAQWFLFYWTWVIKIFFQFQLQICTFSYLIWINKYSLGILRKKRYHFNNVKVQQRYDKKELRTQQDIFANQSFCLNYKCHYYIFAQQIPRIFCHGCRLEWKGHFKSPKRPNLDQLLH